MITLAKDQWSTFGRVVFIRCPECKEKARTDHSVDDFGNISPSVVCPFEGCDFHDYVRLEGWTQRTKNVGKIPGDVLAKIPKVKERLAASASGFVRVMKFSVPDRAALAVLIENGEVEIFDSALGRAYRLVGGRS